MIFYKDLVDSDRYSYLSRVNPRPPVETLVDFPTLFPSLNGLQCGTHLFLLTFSVLEPSDKI